MLVKSFKLPIIVRNFSQLPKKSLGIIGVPFSKGQRKNGVEEAPAALRKAGLVNVLKDRFQVKDFGDVRCSKEENTCSLDNMNNYGEFFGCSKALITKVQEVLRETDVYLAVGGDHAIGFGSVAGHLLANPNLSLIWIDAHPDINLNITSHSGNIHGMPVALMLKELRKFWTTLDIHKIAPNCLPAKELVYIGLRDIDPQEAFILNQLGITVFAMDAVDRLGISKVVEMSLEALNPRNKLHISFDIDALDVGIAPSTGTAVLGGLTLREGLHIMETLCETNRIEGIDMVEINPKIGTQADIDLTLATGMELIKAACGFRRSGNPCSANKLLKF